MLDAITSTPAGSEAHREMTEMISSIKLMIVSSARRRRIPEHGPVTPENQQPGGTERPAP